MPPLLFENLGLEPQRFWENEVRRHVKWGLENETEEVCTSEILKANG
jgi:hypothetical protein